MRENDVITFMFFSEEGETQLFLYHRTSREILCALDEALRSVKCTGTDIIGMAVVLGQGGFTATRLATTIVNTFAFVRRIPVFGITAGEADDHRALYKRFQQEKTVHYVSARYSGKPHIGPPARS